MHLRLLGCASLFGLIACNPGPTLPEGFGVCEPSADAAPESSIDEPTYHREIRPILEDACTGCHVEGGIGPFALTDHAAVEQFGPLMVSSIHAGTMPPWPPSDCCAPLSYPRELSPERLAVIERWLEIGAPEGDPADAPPPPPPGGLSRIDLEVTMPEAYTPTPTIGQYDDQRCFLIDWPLDGETFVTGLEVVPGNRQIVHHAIVYAIPEGQVGIYDSLDDDSAGPGWSCPGGVVQSADAYIGSWVPGANIHDFPEGLGRKVRANSRLLLNVHYELSAGTAPDQTGIQFKLDDAVATEVEGLAVMNPTWLINDAMAIPAGDADVQHHYAYDPATWFNLGQPLHIHNVSLHMHELGSSASLAILRLDGSVDCLLHIEDWDYDWQGEYFLEKPITVRFGDRLYVECHFDNTAENQRDGETPRDLAWGDAEEMCIGSVMISR